MATLNAPNQHDPSAHWYCGVTPEDIEELERDGWIPDVQSTYHNNGRAMTVSQLADFAREHDLAMYRDDMIINTLTPYLPSPPAEADLVMDESLDDEWFCNLIVEEREGQTVLGINLMSPWNAVYPAFDAEYWLTLRVIYP